MPKTRLEVFSDGVIDQTPETSMFYRSTRMYHKPADQFDLSRDLTGAAQAAKVSLRRNYGHL